MTNNEQFAAVILSAGNSQRMGQHKALLPFDENKNFLTQIIEQFHLAGASKIVVVLNHQLHEILKNHNTFANVLFIKVDPNKSRFQSVWAGLEAVRDTDYCFIQNVDNPTITPQIIKKIFLNREKNSYIVPVCEGKGGHPILLPKTIINEILNQIEKNQILRNFLKQFSRKNVIFEENNILININTKKQYNKLKINKL